MRAPAITRAAQRQRRYRQRRRSGAETVRVVVEPHVLEALHERAGGKLGPLADEVADVLGQWAKRWHREKG